MQNNASEVIQKNASFFHKIPLLLRIIIPVVLLIFLIAFGFIFAHYSLNKDPGSINNNTETLSDNKNTDHLSTDNENPIPTYGVDQNNVNDYITPKPLAVTPNVTTQPGQTITPTPVKTSVPGITVTPTPLPTPTPTPIPTPTPTPVLSRVYIRAYYNTGNSDTTVSNAPVKLINKSSGQTFTGFTNSGGYSPDWYIPANTNVEVYLYKPRTWVGTYCGSMWSVNTGPYGTTQTQHLRIWDNGQVPCIVE
jgi:hypothetical protein